MSERWFRFQESDRFIRFVAVEPDKVRVEGPVEKGTQIHRHITVGAMITWWRELHAEGWRAVSEGPKHLRAERVVLQ